MLLGLAGVRRGDHPRLEHALVPPGGKTPACVTALGPHLRAGTSRGMTRVDMAGKMSGQNRMICSDDDHTNILPGILEGQHLTQADT